MPCARAARLRLPLPPSVLSLDATHILTTPVYTHYEKITLTGNISPHLRPILVNRLSYHNAFAGERTVGFCARPCHAYTAANYGQYLLVWHRFDIHG